MADHRTTLYGAAPAIFTFADEANASVTLRGGDALVIVLLQGRMCGEKGRRWRHTRVATLHYCDQALTTNTLLLSLSLSLCEVCLLNDLFRLSQSLVKQLSTKKQTNKKTVVRLLKGKRLKLGWPLRTCTLTLTTTTTKEGSLLRILFRPLYVNVCTYSV